MLSRNEVWEAQKDQSKRCQVCSHKPLDGFCREQLVFGEQRMDWCSDYKPLCPQEGVIDHDPWPKEEKKQKPKRMIQI